MIIAKPTLRVLIQSGGLKHVGGHIGLPKSDIFFDARVFKDGGNAPPTMKNVSQVDYDAYKGAVAMIVAAIHHLPARRRNEVNPYLRPLVITCFCAYGINRSVGLKQYLLKNLPLEVDGISLILVDNKSFNPTYKEV